MAAKKKANTKIASQLSTQTLCAEAVGTTILTLAALASIYAEFPVPTPLVVPLVLIALILSFGRISGAHLNPALTVALVSVKELPWRAGLQYILAQLTGSVLALLTLNLAREFTSMNLLAEGSATVTNLSAEAIGMAVFALAAVAAIRQKLGGGTLAGAVGFGLFSGLVVASVGSAAVINPAIALALSNLSLSAWPYFAGPVVGAVVGAWLYRFLLEENDA